MNYFLIRQDNSLQHIPSFTLFPGRQESHEVKTINAVYTMPGRKSPDQFRCDFPTGGIPQPFLVVDEDAQVYNCAANVTNFGTGGALITGVVLNQDEAPEKDEALQHIEAATKQINPA